MRKSRWIVAITLSASLADCTHYYKQAQESDPHATLTFEQENGSERAWPLRLSGGRPHATMFKYRHTFLIGAGTMRLVISDTEEFHTPASYGPRFTCELSFEAEVGRQYRVSRVWDDNGILYAVTSDTGAKLAECKGREKGEGAIVIQEEAPVYKMAHGADLIRTLKRGDAVVAFSPGWEAGQFQEASHRAHVFFIHETEGARQGWMMIADLAKFTYFFCNYGTSGNILDPGYPFTPYPWAPGKKLDWNVCFREARDAKLRELRAAWAEEK